MPLSVREGECLGVVGDNGAGKSTFIKVMSGAHQPTDGQVYFDDEPVNFKTPLDAIARGIATVYQDLGMIPLMSVARNFFMGNEPEVRRFGIKHFDLETANRITMSEMAAMGINLRGPDQPVGTLSGGERQTIAIARAVYFGAKVLILEVNSAKKTALFLTFLATVDKVRTAGVAVVFISHNIRHALAVGDRFTVLNRGTTLGTAKRGEISSEELQKMMALKTLCPNSFLVY